MLFINGRFYTGAGFSEAVYVEEGIIRAVGKSNDLVKAYPKTETVDLEKRMVIPGFNDSHLHLLSLSRFLEAVNLKVAKSQAEIIRLGRENFGKKKFLLLYGYDDSFFPESLTKTDLDQITPDFPILAYRSCGHIAAVNSAALKLLPDNEYSEYIDSEKGILKENALVLLEDIFPKENTEKLQERILKTVEYLHSFGITSFGSNDIKDDFESGKKILVAYRQLDLYGKLSARVSLQFSFTETEKIKALLEERYESPFLRLGPLKLFLDGSLGGNTALLSEPYFDDYRGLQTLSEEKLSELVEFSEKNGLQVASHAIGDEASALFLKVLKKQGIKNRFRHFLIHLQVLRPELFGLLKELKVPAALQPIFIDEDLKMAKRKLSAKLLETSYALNSIHKATLVAFGSDAPYGGLSPFRGLQAAVTQQNQEGEVLNPKERLSRKEALQAYTSGSAYLTFEEGKKGIIAPGYFGDFTVLSDDFFEIPDKEIGNLRAEMTVVGGKIIYER